MSDNIAHVSKENQRCQNKSNDPKYRNSYDSYSKAKGTTEDSGTLYETKMLSLISIRALHDNNIQQFSMASNIAGKTGFDDIVLRYKICNSHNSQIFFLQLKHKENDSITIEDFTNPKKEFCFSNYLPSYLNLRRSFLKTNNKRIFAGTLKDVECSFIIFTSAKAYFTDEAQQKHGLFLSVLSREEYPPDFTFIKTSEEGQIFQLMNKKRININMTCISQNENKIIENEELINTNVKRIIDNKKSSNIYQKIINENKDIGYEIENLTDRLDTLKLDENSKKLPSNWQLIMENVNLLNQNEKLFNENLVKHNEQLIQQKIKSVKNIKVNQIINENMKIINMNEKLISKNEKIILRIIKNTKENEKLFFIDENFVIECEKLIDNNEKLIHENEQLLNKNKAIINETEKLINRNKKTIEDLVSIMAESRTDDLASSLSEYILKGKPKSWPLKQIFKQYQIFLSQNVIEIMHKKEKRYECKFKQSFLVNDEIQDFRQKICKKLYTAYEDEKVIDKLQSHRFNLPVNFGNPLFTNINQSKNFDIQDICNVFTKLFESEAVCKDLKYNYINIDDQSVADKIVEEKDLKILANLVGTLLIYDDETDMMKFNFNPCMDEDNFNVRVLTQLKSDYDDIELCAFRFDIHYYEFPKLKLNSPLCIEHDRQLVKDFISNFYIYTNQGKERDVEVIIKQNIDNLLSDEQIHDSIYDEKRDAIYMNFHGLIHSWWKEPGDVLCLRENCDYLKKAIRNVLHSRLVNAHFDYSSQILNNLLVRFTREAIFNLNSQLKDTGTTILISDNTYFTSVKIYQYFHEILNDAGYYFIAVETLKNNFKSLILELQYTTIQNLVLIFSSCNSTNEIINKTKSAISEFKGQKLIIIAHSSLENHFRTLFPENVFHKDTSNNFISLSDEIRSIIIKERKIEFQGIIVPVNVLFDEVSLNLLTPSQLHKVIDGIEILKICVKATDEEYEKVIALDNYQKLTLHRCIILNTTKLLSSEMRILKDSLNQELTSINNNDIVLINDSEKIFKEICERNPQINIHWCSEDEKRHVVWKASYGNIHNIVKYISKITSDNGIEMKSLTDLDDRVVIISADPGMGKSTLLSHLANHTSGLWIEKISLFDNITQFKIWKNNKTKIDLIEAMRFLYVKIISRNLKRYHNFNDSEFFIDLSIKNENEIVFNENDTYTYNRDMSEYKIFTHFYNNGKVALLFDGYDEIASKYAVEVTQLLCILKTSRICKLWITSRPYNALVKLECDLGTLSFDIKPLTKSQQVSYLMKIWSDNWPLSDIDTELIDSPTVYPKTIYHTDGTIEESFFSPKEYRDILIDIRTKKMNMFTDIFLSVINSVIGDTKHDFTANTQNLFIIAEVYERFAKKYYDYFTKNKKQFQKDLESNANLTTLFEKYMRKKFYDIKYGQKIPKQIRQQMNDVLEMVDYLDDEYDTFIQSHKVFAAHLLLDKNLLTSNDNEILEEFIKKLESNVKNTGLINFIERPIFVHFSYAEYFVVEFIFVRLLSGCTDMCRYLFEYLLSSNEHGIQRFINSKLQNNHNNIMNSLIARYHIHIKDVFNVAMGQNSNLQIETIAVAIENDFENISLFLLECFRVVVNEENVTNFIHLINRTNNKYCILCAAIAKGKGRIIKLIIELITQINSGKIRDLFYCQDIKKFNPLLLAMCTEKMAAFILGALKPNPDLMVDLFTLNHEEGRVPTVAHSVGERTYTLKYCWEFLKMLSKEQLARIFILTKDKNGLLPAHYAALDNNPEFFKAMQALLGQTDYDIMCQTVDNDGNTPQYILSCVSERHDNFVREVSGRDDFTFCLSNSMMNHVYSTMINELYGSDQHDRALLNSLVDGD